ncbi:MAG TPA: hypothetical protein VHQ43_02350 [Solirubrobacterales bacterium]|jgi:hypothetical protein|nr:hypothetical protein [Solirubrobacterales bacterium]
MSVEDGDRLIQQGLLVTILGLHPEHLTADELVLKMATGPDPGEREAIKQAIRDLSRSGLLRSPDGVVEPTHAAVRTDEVLGWHPGGA